jgi:hypothetical protein
MGILDRPLEWLCFGVVFGQVSPTLEREVLFGGSLRVENEDFDTLITAVTFELTGQLTVTIVLGE